MDITSVNSQIILNIPALNIEGLSLAKFSADNILAFDEIILTDGRVGVDGQGAFGHVKEMKSFTINLEADSPSLPSLYNIVNAVNVSNVPYPIVAIITIPSIDLTATYIDGTIKSFNLPNIDKMLSPVAFNFHFAKLAIITKALNINL